MVSRYETNVFRIHIELIDHCNNGNGIRRSNESKRICVDAKKSEGTG
jgi:hypothetical protein